jgi:hypothetical protein
VHGTGVGAGCLVAGFDPLGVLGTQLLEPRGRVGSAELALVLEQGAEERAHVTDRAHLDVPVVGHAVGLRVDVDHRDVVAERRRAAVPEPEVEVDPQSQHDVGLPERMLARQPQEVRVGGREDPAGHAVDEQRQLRELHQLTELFPRLCPVRARPRQHHRVLGRGEQVGGAGHGVGIGPRSVRERATGGDDVVGVDGGHQHVHRQVDVGRSHPRRTCLTEGVPEHLGQPPGLEGGVRPLRDGTEQLDLWGVLERTHALQGQRVAAAEQDHRRVGVERVGHARDGVGDPRASGDRSDAGCEGEPGVGVGGVRSGLFVPHVDHPDPDVLAAVVDRADVAAREGEQRIHPFGRERFRDQTSAVSMLSHTDLPVPGPA